MRFLRFKVNFLIPEALAKIKSRLDSGRMDNLNNIRYRQGTPGITVRVIDVEHIIDTFQCGTRHNALKGTVIDAALHKVTALKSGQFI